MISRFSSTAPWGLPDGATQANRRSDFRSRLEHERADFRSARPVLSCRNRAGPLQPARRNRPDAAGLERAAEFGIATAVVDHKDFPGDREAFERQVDTVLREHDIELVALAGFMRILTPFLVNAWANRMINIYPALLPSFKGLATHERWRKG